MWCTKIILQDSVIVKRKRSVKIKNMAKITEYGKKIKFRLLEMDKTQVWLISEVRAKTGLYFDDSYLYKIMFGSLRTPKIVTAINEILEIVEADGTP